MIEDKLTKLPSNASTAPYSHPLQPKDSARELIKSPSQLQSPRNAPETTIEESNGISLQKLKISQRDLSTG